MTITFEQSQAAFLRAEEAKQKVDARYKKCKDKRDFLCPHTELDPHSFYYNGGYLDTSYTDQWNVCKCCGAESEVFRENHGHYG